MGTREGPAEPAQGADGLDLIDCDVHQRFRSIDELVERLPPHFRERGFALPGSSWSNPHGVFRRDADPDGEGAAGSSPALLREQHVDRHDVDACVLTGSGVLSVGVTPDADYATAVARAYNDWLVDEWLTEDPRFFGSMIVAAQAPERAAEEIRRLGSHPRIVQVLLSSANAEGIPYGRRYYWPIYEAAAELGLPVAIHPGTEGRGAANPPSGAGYPSTYFEWHTTLPANYIGQLTSLVCQGVFAEYPDLRFVCIEGGLAWVPHLCWRLDKNWKGLRTDAPWLERPPSEYVREHVRFTTQPIEEPENPEHLRQILEMMHADETVMFSSDYPHWDYDSPERGLPSLSEPMRSNVRHRTARALYDLPDDPASVPAPALDAFERGEW